MAKKVKKNAYGIKYIKKIKKYISCIHKIIFLKYEET